MKIHKKYGIERHAGGANDVGIVFFESDSKAEIKSKIIAFRKIRDRYGYRLVVFPKYMRSK